MDLVRICDQIIEKSFYLLFFFVPLILTPFNYELFEYNKMMLVYFFTAIIVAAWLIKMVATKKIIFRRSFLDIPLLIFLISQLISYFFSIDRHTSFWGYYSRFHGGLASTIAFLALYWAYVTNMDRSKVLRSLFFILSSAALVAAYGVAEHFGIDKDYWVQDVQNRVFSTLGQPNWLAAYLVALIPLTWAFAIGSKRKFIIPFRRNPTLWAYSLFFILFICLLYTKSRSGFLGFAVAYLVFWGLIFLPGLTKRKKIYQQFKTNKQLKPFLLITILLSLITLFIGTPWTPNLGQLYSKLTSPPPQPDSQLTTQSPPPVPVGGTESGEIRRIVWQGAIDIWRHYPLWGTGPETFAYVYYNFRPREHNDVSEWDFLYNKAHNEYLNIAANTGTVGLLAYLGVIGAFIFWSIKEIKKSKKSVIKDKKSKNDLNILISQCLSISLLAGYSSILITNFFGFSVVVVGLFFFLFPAMSIILASPTKGVKGDTPLRCEHTYTLGIGQWLAIGAILLSLLTTHYSLLKYWYADTLFAKGKKLNEANQNNQAFEKLQTAVQLNPGEPFFHDELSRVAAELAVAAHQQGEASLSAELVDLALAESDRTLEITPTHLNYWKNRTRVFFTLAEIDKEYQQDALASLLQATELAPTDAKVFYNLAVLYGRLGQNQTAIETLEKTIELKPNYETARWALALFYEQEGNLENAKNELEYILERINPKNKKVKEKLEAL